MPFAQIDGAQLHYVFDGPAGAPVIIFSNSLGADFSMWDAQIPAFVAQFRILRCDTRGHGRSSVTSGPYTIERLGRDVVGLMDALKIDRAHFCGLSMGGLIGMWLGINAAHRLNRLVLCDTAARIGTPEKWNERIETVRAGGMASVASSVIERWFTPAFAGGAPAQVERTRQMLLQTPPGGYAACCGALRDADLRGSIAAIRTPTLAIAGVHDPTTTPADARFLTGRIPGARHVELEAAHLSNIEAAQEFNQAVLQFLGEPEAK